MDSFYRNKIIAITGGSSGIGHELARQLTDQGATVVIGARNPVVAEAVVTELTAKGGTASYVAIDVQKPEECEKFFAAVVQQHGRLDYAFNCAGVIMGGEIRDHTIEDITKVLSTNVLGTSYCAYYAYQIMVGQGYGHLVNISSGAGLFPLPLMGVYSASKFAITGLSEAMRIEGAALGVKVSVVTPGVVDTPLYDKAIYSKTEKNQAIELLKKRASMIPADVAVTKILQGTKANKAIISTQFNVYSTWLTYRLVPWAYRNLVRRILPVYRSKYRTSSEELKK